MNAPDILQIQSVSRRFGIGSNTVQALRQVSLACPAGTWTAVMGPSGSGKSTLLNCAAGLDRPTEGRILLAGEELGRLNDNQLTQLRRTQIGFVFQGFNLIAALTAEQNVTLPLRLAGRSVDRSAARRVLAELGLADRLQHRPKELSGGQQQRVALARALVTRPAMLYADEPTGALDSSSAAVVLDLIRDMVDRRGQTVLMVTHDPVVAARADRVVLMCDGQIVDQLGGGCDAMMIANRLTSLEQAA